VSGSPAGARECPSVAWRPLAERNSFELRQRLVDVEREPALFARLAADLPGFELQVVEAGGRVATDTTLLAKRLAEVTRG
jgi:hypothetical protein